MMAFNAQQIAEHIQGTIRGNSTVLVNKINGLKQADNDSLSFLSKQSYISLLEETNASIVVIDKQTHLEPKDFQCFISVENVGSAVQSLSVLFKPMIHQEFIIADNSSVHQNARVADSVNIGAFTVIEQHAKIDSYTHIGSQVYIAENVQIGMHCVIYPGVKIYANTLIGNHVIIHSNAVIGSDGFGYNFTETQLKKIEHLGNVIIKDHVEIGSNTVIDRAVFDSTIIKEGTKLDNLVQLAHNVEIGKHTVIAAQSGISGSTRIGDYVQLGGQVGIAGHLDIADGSQIQAQSGVPSSIKEKNKKWYGYPTLPFRAYLRSYALFKKLPQMFKELLALRKDVDELKK